MSTGELYGPVRALRKRVRVLLAERCGLYGASAGCIAGAAMALLSSRVEVLLDQRLWVGSIVLGGAIGVLVGLLRPLDDMSVAAAADRRAALDERLSSAVAVSSSGAQDDMAQALLHDARQHISSLSASQVFRHRYSLPHYVFAASFVLFLIAVYLPLLPMMQSSVRRQEVAVMKRQGAKLTKVAKQIKHEAGPRQQELRKLAARLDTLGRRMQTGRMTRKSAMIQTRHLNREVQKLQDRLARANSGTKSMLQARLDMRKASEQLQKQNPAKGDLGKSAPLDPKLAELARKNGPLSAGEKKALEQAVAKYADPKSALPIPAELGEALAKLAENKDFQKASELMQKLAQKLGSGRMSKQDREALARQLQALAKALRGTDLDKLARMMRENAQKLAKMSPAELKKLADQMAQMKKMSGLLAKAGTG